MNNAKQLYDEINSLLAQNKLDEAEAIATKAMKMLPGYHSIQERLAHVQLRKGNHLDAEQNYKEIISKCPDKVHPWIGLINSLLLQGRIIDAENVVREATSLFPDEFSVLERTAHVQLRKGMYSEAQKSYESILDRFPDKTQAWVGLTSALLSQNKISDAERVAGEAIILFPGEFSVLERFAHTQQRRGMHCYAERIFRIIIERFPDKAPAWTGLTNSLLSQDKLNEAEGVAGKAKTLFPDDFSVLERFAHIQHRKLVYLDAEKSHRILSERFPDKVQAWTGLTNALLAQNKMDDAESVARKAAALFPQEFSAMERYAHCCLRNNKLDDSRRAYRSIDRTLMTPAQYNDYASALDKLGEHEEAKTIYGLALKNFGDHHLLTKGFSNFLSRIGDHQSLMDFIDKTYIDPAKKTALVIGNCQSAAMSSILELHDEFTSEYSIIKALPPIQDMSIELQHFVADMLLPRIDLLVTQNLVNPLFPLQTNVARGTARSTIVFPTFYFAGYFPDMVLLKVDDTPLRNAHLTNYHSALVITSYIDGITPEECARRLTSGDWIERGYDAYLSSLFEELHLRERLWDVKCTDHLYQNHKNGILFHTVNHPNACLLHNAANSLLGILGMCRLSPSSVNATSEILCDIQWIVNDNIRDALSLGNNGSGYFTINRAKMSALEFVLAHYQHYESNISTVQETIATCRNALYSWQEEDTMCAGIVG